MRAYQRILLVAVLSIGLIAAGAAWVRCCVSPLADEAEFKPEGRDSANDGLPADVWEELLASKQPSRAEPTSVVVTAGPNESSLTAGDAVPRSGNGGRQVTNIEVADNSPGRLENNADARQIHRAQSAEYVEATAGQRNRPSTANPSSAANAMQTKNEQDALHSIDDLDLMRRLRADDGEQRGQARQELVKRGFSEVDFELARQLFSSDVEARKNLARALPRLSSVDAARWLLWLAQDPQPEVRLVAISTLATTGDSALLSKVEALAANDHDPQIKALAEQIRKQEEFAKSRGGSIDGNQFR
jgi:hypothetical protein